MSKFQQYNINLKDLKSTSEVFEFILDDDFFKKINSPDHEVDRGNLKVKVTVQKKLNTFELEFVIDGIVLIPCNRCLDYMEQPINHKERLKVKFGDRFSEENDTVIVPEIEGSINIAWFLYEFIVLSIPLKHVHAPGECNKTMVSKLKRHIAHRKGDDDDDSDMDLDDDDDYAEEDIPIDPRWEGLQNFSENN